MTEQPSPPSERAVFEQMREERALADRLRRVARRSPAENLAAGLELIRTANDFRAAFEQPPRR